MARLHRDRLLLVALAHLPARLAEQPVHEGGHRIGIRLLDAEVHHLVAIAVDPRRRQRHHRRLSRQGRAERIQRHVRGLRAALHPRREAGVDGALDVWGGAEAGGEVDELRPAREQELLHVLVERDVRPAEAVDGLLGVAHHEQLPLRRPRRPPANLRGIVAGDEQQDLRLQRVGVLELVHQHVGEALPQLGADLRIADQQIPGAQQEIEEVQAAGALLEALVGCAERPQILAQAGGQIGVAGAQEGVQLRLHLLAQRRHGGALDARREPLALAAPVP